MKRTIMWLGVVIFFSLLPVGHADAAEFCEICDWCLAPESPEFETCRIVADRGFPDCSSLSCFSQLCTVGPAGEECGDEDNPSVMLNRIDRDRRLARLVGPNAIEEIVALDGVTLYLGEISLAMPPPGVSDFTLASMKFSPACGRLVLLELNSVSHDAHISP